MSITDDFDFDPVSDDFDASDDFFNLDETDQKNDQTKTLTEELPSESIKRSSADFEPDMDLLLISAQTPMIIEAMKLISMHDFKSKNTVIFSEAIKGIELYMKILARNPENYKKVSAMLASDPDFRDFMKITINLFRNIYNEPPATDSQNFKAFELVKDHLDMALKKSLISSSIISIKKYFLLSGTPDVEKIDTAIKETPDRIKSEFAGYGRHVNIARELIKTGNYEINKGMKGKEVNIFIVKATMLLIYYYTQIGEMHYVSYYQKLHDNFKRYFVVR